MGILENLDHSLMEIKLYVHLIDVCFTPSRCSINDCWIAATNISTFEILPP